MNCISCTSMCHVQMSCTTAKPNCAPFTGSMNLLSNALLARSSRVLKMKARNAVHPNIPPTTAKTFHVLKMSSNEIDMSSSMEMGLILGGELEALKSVAWLHKHCTAGATKHPHPSKACVDRRQ